MIYILLCIVILIVLFMIFTAHHDTINYQTIQDDHLPSSFDKYHIFYISDIHRRNIKQSTLEKIKTDISQVMIGGDLTEKNVPIERTRANLRKLKKFDVPIYFVWGNNDYEVSPRLLEKVLIEEDVIILKDSYVTINKNDDLFHLVGFDYHEECVRQSSIDWDCLNDGYCLLLTHVPQCFYDLENITQRKINTVLAGHTHGGQIRLFGLGFYQRGGLATFRHTNVLISEGYGYTFLPFRLQTRSECHVLTFIK